MFMIKSHIGRPLCTVSAMTMEAANEDNGDLFMASMPTDQVCDCITLQLAMGDKPKCLDAVLKRQDKIFEGQKDEFFDKVAHWDDVSMPILEVLIRHSAKHNFKVNGADGDELLLHAVTDGHDKMQEFMLADGINMNAVHPTQGHHVISATAPSLPCLLILLEDGRAQISQAPAALHMCILLREAVDSPLLHHHVHELLKAGVDPSYRHPETHKTAMELGEADGADNVETCKVIHSYMEGNPIEQRVVEMIVVDEKGRTIRHRFYADDTEKMSLHLLPHAFDKYKDSLKVKDMRIMPNGKSRMTFTFTKDIGDGKSWNVHEPCGRDGEERAHQASLQGRRWLRAKIDEEYS